MPKKNRYNKVRERPVKGDEVARPWTPSEVGTVFAGVPRGRGFSVCVDWGDDLVLFEPMSELVLVKEAPREP